MFSLGVVPVGLAFLCYLVYRLVASTWRARQLKIFARDNGCEEPFDLSGGGPFAFVSGWKRVGRIIKMKESGEDLLDDIFAAQFKSSNTHKVVQLEGSVEIVTIEPANIQAMLATQFKDFGMGERRINQFYPVLGNSIFSSDDAHWERARSLFRPQFNREHINDLDETEDAAKALVQAIGEVDPNGWTKETNMMPLLYNFTLDTATSFLFGESVGSQRLTMGENHHQNTIQVEKNRQFTQDFETSSSYMLLRIRNASLYWLADGFEFRNAARRVKTFTEQFVRRALASSPTEKLPAGKKYNLLSALATSTQDVHELRNQTLAILLAGRDTTAGLLGWSFTRLALHPEIFSKLRQTILKDFLPGEEITFSKLKGCRYLQHFFNEVLRLHPIVPVNNRCAVRDTTLPVGGGVDEKSPIVVSKGQIVAFSVYLMHRRKDLWGEDALEFKPERWSENRYPAWQFLPFSGGPRICLGQQFALTEASFVLVRMLQHFDRIEPMDWEAERKLTKGLGLTMWPANSRVRFHKA